MFVLHLCYLQPIDSAELIFYTFLERYPENQQKFAAFKDKPLNQLKVSFRLSFSARHLTYIVIFQLGIAWLSRSFIENF